MLSDPYVNQHELICNAQRGDMAALDALMKQYCSLVNMLAGRLLKENAGREELVQAGNLGLLYAIKHYDASQETKLITYAVPWILGEMRSVSRRMQTEAHSLDRPIDGEQMTLYDVLCGTSGVDIGKMDLRLALSRLKQDEQILICLRYYRDKTQKETAEILRKSQAQISRMERHALDELHAMLS